jgi:galactose mutarotase-like enzyme
MRAWRAGGLDLLWSPDPSVWNAVSPVLFPVVGWCRDGMARAKGLARPMPVHGFAAARDFACARIDDARMRFQLEDDAGTRAHYPYRFQLTLEYALEPRALTIEARVSNPGDEPMPYAFGLHPGFRWPLFGAAAQAHRIVFAQAEAAHTPVIAPGGLFSQARRAVPLEGRALPLAPELFAQEALCFLDAHSRSLAYEGPAGAIEAEAEGFAHWALWSRPGAPFLCVEAWTGHGDPVGFEGELAQKPSMILLAPGETRTHRVFFRLRLA